MPNLQSFIEFLTQHRKIMKQNRKGVRKIWVAGLRGIPSLSGGVEQVVERLYPQLKELCEEQEMNVAITIANRSQYFPKRIDSFESLQLRYLSSPDLKGFESLLHSGYSLWSAFRDRADVIHLHAIGAWIWAPIARLLGIRVCLYHHGNDHLRDKWGFAARIFLRSSMHFGSLFAHRVYLLNPVHMANLPLIQKGKVRIVPNGIDCEGTLREEVSQAIEMKTFLFVGRVTPEKNVLELIRAFNLLCQQRQITPSLRVIGPAAHGEEAYFEACQQEAALNPRIDFMGPMPPAKVKEYYRPDAVLTLLSSIEGMPMVALEAIAGGCRLLLSNIPEHEVFEDNFDAKRVDPAQPEEIVEAMQEMIDTPHGADHIIENMKTLKKNHTWENSAMILRDDLKALLAGK
jgi:glycosyltransferase involved in cell wall biosynthesis